MHSEKWAMQALVGVVCFSSTAVFYRHLCDVYPGIGPVAFLGGFCLVMGACQSAWLKSTGQRVVPRTRGLCLMVAGIGVGVTLSNLCAYEALRRAPNPGLPYMIWQTNPVWLLLLGVCVFRERVRPVQWAGVVLAMLGGAWIAYQSVAGKGTGEPWVALSFGWVVLGSVGLSLVNWLDRKETVPPRLGALGLKVATWLKRQGNVPIQTSLCVFFWTMVVICLVFLGQWKTLARQPGAAWGLIAVAGAFGTVGNIAMFSAYSHASNPGLPGSFQALQPLLIAAGATAMLGSAFPGDVLFGLLLVVPGTLMVALSSSSARNAVNLQVVRGGKPEKVVSLFERRR